MFSFPTSRWVWEIVSCVRARQYDADGKVKKCGQNVEEGRILAQDVDRGEGVKGYW